MPQQTTAEKAAAIRKRLAREIEALRANRDLSAEGRRRQIARVVQRGNEELRELRVGEQRKIEERRESLVRKLFRNPTPRDPASVVSYRDAQDRAAAVRTGGDALRMYQRAVRTGDELLARALAVRATERGTFGGSGWTDVLHAWADTEPGARDALDELGQIAAVDTTRGRMARQLATSSAGTPSELRGVPDMDRLTARADDGIDTE